MRDALGSIPKSSPAPTFTASSPSVTTTAAAAADLDPLREPQQPAQEAVPVPGATTTHEDAKEESDAEEVTSQKSDEKMEDKHEEKTESDHQETQDGDSNAFASGSQEQAPIPRQESSSEHGQRLGDVDESASSPAVEPTPVPEIAQAKEAPQAMCLSVGMYQWPTKDHQTQMPNVYLRLGSSEDVTTTQLLQAFGSSRSIAKYCECNLHK